MKIPEHAKKVFEGTIFGVYQWQQKMFDGSEETFERLKRPATVAVIPTMGSSVLISEEEQPLSPKCFTLRGGRQEKDEEPLACGKRELVEEAGLVSDDWELLRVYEPVSKIDWQVYIFIARSCRKVGEQKLDAGERITIKELSFDAFLDLVSSKDFFETEFAADIMRMRLASDASTQVEKFQKQLFG